MTTDAPTRILDLPMRTLLCLAPLLLVACSETDPGDDLNHVDADPAPVAAAPAPAPAAPAASTEDLNQTGQSAPPDTSGGSEPAASAPSAEVQVPARDDINAE